MIRFRCLKWRTERNRDTAVRYLDLLALALERRGWRCVKSYRSQVVPARTPLLLVSGAGVAVSLCVLAAPGGGWAFHEAPRGRGGFLCFCGGDIKQAAQVIDRFLQDRPLRQ
ncbi:hypothetical protein [Spirillospora sp. NPDC048824]|uniref:hypothetical protein n=1 Tax=Spirillospora sp. NPDC048824 TaxID=3364526 RepID=UPI00371FC3BE